LKGNRGKTTFSNSALFNSPSRNEGGGGVSSEEDNRDRFLGIRKRMDDPPQWKKKKKEEGGFGWHINQTSGSRRKSKKKGFVQG